ncbi:phosphate regulon sensor histidine kinase PhoR [Ostreibacterium oceani]|uniref:Phosphate regulon sensor protein PhoR n=1 Tax=Ostreibacterium oceani TaxID=2654998 RepID=A0A6N7EUW6_9GAMM|nr:phosphate regulon sensor histidine kinase PhoR [Ostreibacterium oceani]MPV85405.1 phosphate regulon sensor histidine kinase PhoR [Ostreibacterium oceani]
MINHAWGTEFRLIGLFVVMTVVAGWISQQWTIVIAVSAVIYLVMLLRKLHALHQWLLSGLSDQHLPDYGGVLGEMVTLMYRHKKKIETSNTAQIALTQQFHETISAIPSATIILNTQEEIEWANSAALSLLGIDGQRDLGIKIENLLRSEMFIKHLRSKQTENFEMMSPVSNELTLSMQLVPYSQQRKLLIAHNISSHIALQRSRRTFIANASHELRTPLTVIAGYLEYVHSDDSLPEALKTPVEKAMSQAQNMEQIISDLLSLSKLENKLLKKKDIQLIDLQVHLDKIMHTIYASGQVAARQVKISVTSGLAIEACEKDLDSLCYNLINNAIKYSDEQGTIQITWQPYNGAYAMLQVSDDGIGIPPEHIGYLTERFYRVDSGRSRRVGGTGLGLSIVKHILERHNGRLEISSRVGEGSIFTAILPKNPLA